MVTEHGRGRAGCAQRLEQKLTVRSWNAALFRRREQTSPVASAEAAAGEIDLDPRHLDRKAEAALLKLEMEARMEQWGSSDVEIIASDPAPEQLDAGSVVNVSASSSNANYGIPRSVDQIKRAYRTRARQEEASDDKRAVVAGKVCRERTQARTGSKWRSLWDAGIKEHNASHEQNFDRDDTHVPTSNTTPESSDTSTRRVLDLDVPDLSANTAAVDALLRVIRRELSTGRDVLLQCRPTRAAVPVVEAKLILQQLCIQSLLFCARDQELVPSGEQDQLVLHLHSRTRAAVTIGARC